MSLQLWMPLTKDLRQQGVSGITPTQTTGYTSVAAGKLGGCYKFTGTFNTLLPLSNWNWTEGSVSFGCWAKISQSELATLVNAASYDATYNSMGGTLLGRDSYGGLGLRWKTNNIYSSSTLSAVYIYVHMRNTSSSSNSTSNYTIPFDTWFHVMTVIDRNENKIKVYINGELFTTTNLTVTGTFNTGTFRIAEATWDDGNGRSSAGCWQLNDVRVYNHALSQMEVKELAKGLILHYPLDRQGWGQENLITNSKLDGSWTYPSSSYSDKYSPITTIVPSATQYTLSFDAKSTVNGDKIRTHYYSPNTTTTCVSSQGITKTAADGNMDFTLTTQWKRYWVIYTQTETTAVKHLICPRLVSGQGTGTVSVKNVKFEEGSIATPWCPNSSDALATTMGLNGTTEYDCSGFCNNGEYYAYDTNGSISYTSDTPKYNVSTHIASANPTQNAASGTRYLYGHCELTNPMQMSVAFWLKPITGGYGGTTSNGQGYFCTTNYEYGNISVGSDYQASAMNHRDGAVNMNDSASTTQCNVTFYPTIGEWHHYVYTYDGQVGRGYKDGVQTATAQFSAAKTLDSFIGVVIGFSKAGGVWRRNDACYSDFRVYATALSADDVKSLYQNCATIDPDGTIRGQIRS